MTSSTVPFDSNKFLDDAGQILRFMYVTTDVVNQYKYTTANFLEDNNSVSSIPRNYRSLRDKHLSWLRDYIAHVERSAPAWDSVVDEVSYSAAIKNLGNFKESIISDASLTQSELQFISDVRTIRISLIKIKGEMEALLSSKQLEVVKTQLGSEGVQLEATLRNAKDCLDKHITLIPKMSAQIRLCLDRRIYLKTTVPTTWLQILDLRLMRVNAGTAAQIIDRIEKILNGPQVRTSIKAELSNIRERANALLNIYLCPHLARRAVLGGIARILELRQSLQEQPITEDDKARIEEDLATTERSLKSINSSITSALKDLPSYISERSREVSQQLTGGVEFTGECEKLAQSIINAIDGDSGNDTFEQVRNELNFIEFKSKCAIPTFNQPANNFLKERELPNAAFLSVPVMRLLNFMRNLLKIFKK